jgi:hypothetical protein
VQQWYNDARDASVSTFQIEMLVAARAAQWGADQELEACCEWFVHDWTDIETADKLRAARRPKPPSLKKQGLTALKLLKQRTTDPNIIEPLSQAVEQLDD